MYYRTLFLSILLSLIFCAPALAQNIFVGGSVGNGFNNKNLGDISGEDFKIKESNVAWKVFAAAHWKFLGAEGGYRDFGKIEKRAT